MSFLIPASIPPLALPFLLFLITTSVTHTKFTSNFPIYVFPYFDSNHVCCNITISIPFRKSHPSHISFIPAIFHITQLIPRLTPQAFLLAEFVFLPLSAASCVQSLVVVRLLLLVVVCSSSLIVVVCRFVFVIAWKFLLPLFSSRRFSSLVLSCSLLFCLCPFRKNIFLPGSTSRDPNLPSHMCSLSLNLIFK